MINKFNLFLDKLFMNITNWIIQNKYRFVGFIILSLLIVTAFFLPYLNLIFSIKFVIFSIIALFFVIFRIDWKIILYITIALFILAFILTVINFTPIAMVIGDYIYGLLVIIAIEYFIQI